MPRIVSVAWAILSLLVAGSAEPSDRAEGPAPGDVVSDFAVTALDGTTFSLSQEAARHKAIVFVFFSVTCPYSNRFAKSVSELSASHDVREVLWVGVNSNRTETSEAALAYARQHGHTFPTVKDSSYKVADALGARVTPEAFVVDGGRRLRFKGQVVSKIGRPYLEEALQALLSGRTVRTPVAKAFGCAIDRD